MYKEELKRVKKKKMFNDEDNVGDDSKHSAGDNF